MGDKCEAVSKNEKQPPKEMHLLKTNSESFEKLQKVHEQSTASTLFRNTVEAPSSSTVVGKLTPDTNVSRHKVGKKNEKNSKENIEVVKKHSKEDKKASIIYNESPVPKPRVGGAASETAQKGKIFRNQSDIFSLIEEPNAITSIFSVNGAPSRRVFCRKEKREVSRNSFGNTKEPPSDAPVVITRTKLTRENYNDEKRPSSSYRNPLTGTGLSSNDEYTKKELKKKVDGNPLLGLGYGSEAVSSGSSHRIPPGGYAHKLW